MVNDIEQALDDAAQAQQHGADLVEFRVDTLFSGSGEPSEIDACLLLSKRSALPCIVTCRSAEEGGHYDGPDDARIALYEALGTSDHPPAYIDLEFSTWQRSANLRQKVLLGVAHKGQQKPGVTTRLILSHHNLEGRPADLIRTLAQMRQVEAAAILKIAYTARSIRDNLELFEILRDRDRPTIALGMGEPGLMSRVLAPKFGAFLTFASLRDNSTTAPGQPTIRDLLDRYRFRSITPSTNILGVVGWPVSHSLSPLLHNAGFEDVGFDGVYLPLPVAPSYEGCKASLTSLLDDPNLDLAGASITIPHKQHALRLAEELAWEIDDLASRASAANTIVRNTDSIEVHNTDIEGITSPLVSMLGDLSGARVLILGAGGAARAAAFAMLEHDAIVHATNRSQDNLDTLCAHLNTIAPVPWDQRHTTNAQIIINTTTVGMSTGPAPDESPIDLHACSNLPDNAVVFDTVYAPRDTPLLRQARTIGLRTVGGIEMFIEQAARQFSLWTEHDAPRQHWRELLEEHS